MVKIEDKNKKDPTSFVTKIRGLKETPQALALRALRLITKSSNTTLQLDEVPKELLFGEIIDFQKWSLILKDQALKELSEQKESGKKYFLDCSSVTIQGMFKSFWKQANFSNGIISLNLSSAKDITDYGLTLISNTNPELRILNISGCIKITDIGLREIAIKCSKLQHLDMSSCPNILGPGLIATAEVCPFLTKLNLSKCSHIENYSLQKIFRKCIRLEDVNLSYMKDLTDEEVRVLAENCPDLYSFEAVECLYLSDQSVINISRNCKDIDSLDFSRSDMTYRITDVSLMALGQHSKSLRILKFNNCDHISDVGLAWLTEGCYLIESLELNGCNKLTDAALRVLGASCHALTYLDVSYAKSISDVGLASLAKGCKKLKTLKCQGSFLLSDPRFPVVMNSEGKPESWEEVIGVTALAIYCTELQHVDFSGCFRLNKVLAQSISTLKLLKILNLKGCNQTSAASLISLAKGCPLVEELNLSDCGKGVNNEVLDAFSQRCPNIKYLTLCRCLEIKSLGVKAISNVMKLEKLDLSGCVQLTDNSLVHLTSSDKNPLLRSLEMNNAQKVTDSFLAWLSMKDHKFLYVSLKGTAVSQKALSSVRDRFPNSDMLINNNFYGFYPKFRVEDRILINRYYYTILGITKIQARLRKHLASLRVQSLRYYHKLIHARIRIQTMVRGFLKRLNYRKLMVTQQGLNYAAIRVTGFFRIVLAKNIIQQKRDELYQKYLESKAVLIQSKYRSHLAKKKLKKLKKQRARLIAKRNLAAKLIQSIGRRYLACVRILRMKELKKMKLAVQERKAIAIQRCYRGYIARYRTQIYRDLLSALMKKRILASSKIQYCYRRFRTISLVLYKVNQKNRRRNSAIMIQSLIRGALARLHISEIKWEIREKKKKGAATRIQCIWRVYVARNEFFRRIKERRNLKLLHEKAANKIINQARIKLARLKYKRKYEEYISRLTKEAERCINAVTKIQALFRRFKGRLIFYEKLNEQKTKWKELFDEKEKKRFFYNKLTGEIRWRIPQDLLDLIPRPICDNCEDCEAALECRVCNEIYCGPCFQTIHRGGRRKEHEFRAMYDFYGKRLDYGDGEFPCQWPSEIIQDEIQGWMLRIAPHRQPHRTFPSSGWEEYYFDLKDLTEADPTILKKNTNQKRLASSMGKQAPTVFYFNRKTFQTAYEMPPEVISELAAQEYDRNQPISYSLDNYNSQSNYNDSNRFENSYKNTSDFSNSARAGVTTDYSQLGYYDEQGNWLWYSQDAAEFAATSSSTINETPQQYISNQHYTPSDSAEGYYNYSDSQGNGYDSYDQNYEQYLPMQQFQTGGAQTPRVNSAAFQTRKFLQGTEEYYFSSDDESSVESLSSMAKKKKSVKKKRKSIPAEDQDQIAPSIYDTKIVYK